MSQRPASSSLLSTWSWHEHVTFVAGLVATSGAIVATRVASTPGWVRFWDNVHWTVAYAVAARVAWLSVRRASGDLASARRWFALGLTCLMLGQLAWDVQVAVGWNPFPGPSDALFVLLGPFLGVGVLVLARARPRERRVAIALDGVGFGLSLLALTLATYLPRRGDVSSVTLAVLAAYPTFLLTVTALLGVVVLERREPPSRALALFGAGLLGQGLLWMTWNLSTLQNALGDGLVLNYLFSYGALALGAAVALYEPSETSVEGAWARGYYAVSRLVPLALVVAAAAAVVLSNGASRSVQFAVQSCMVAVILVAVVRQSLLLEERERRVAVEANTREVERRMHQAQRLESLGTLASGIAHDFNNILAGILGHAELLASMRELPPAAQESAAGVRSGAIRAREVTRRILAFSRHESATPETVRVHELIGEVVTLLRAALPARHAIEVSGEVSLAVRASPAQLHQVLMNLGTNASQAIGDRAGTIELSAAAIDDAGAEPRSWVEIRVSDDGCGMDAQTQKRVFEPFFTTKTREQGTGLGLSVVHAIVSEHGGTVVIESSLGKGTSFRVRLPADRSPAPSPESNPEPAPLPVPVSEAPEPEPVGTELLVVDDERMIGTMLVGLLKSLGQSARAVSSPDEALDLVRAEPGVFRLVITDMSMPTMTGLQLAAALRKAAPRLVIVLSSGTDFVVAGTEFDDVLPKPYTIDAVSAMLARRSVTRA